MGILPELFFSFARIGAFTFGGGYAMLSLLCDVIKNLPASVIQSITGRQVLYLCFRWKLVLNASSVKTLEQEIAHARAYAEVQKLRFGSRITIILVGTRLPTDKASEHLQYDAL